MNIIVVDDLAPIALTYKAILARAGYEVEAFTHSDEAIAYMQANPTSFDLVITDIYMPETNGVDLIHAARQINPNAKTLCITGGGGFDQDTSLMQQARQIADMLSFKPIHSAQLTNTVNTLMREQKTAANG